MMRADGFSPVAVAAFESFFRPWMRLRMTVRAASLPRDLPSDIPLVMVANHSSWWDPFAMREVQRLLRPGAPVRTLMLERELARRPYFRYLGVIGIDPESAGSIRRALRRLQDGVSARPDTVVFFFPQGRIWPSFRRPLGFARGIEFFAKHVGQVAFLPIGLHVEPLAGISPVAFANVGSLIRAEGHSRLREILEWEVERLVDRILLHLAEHGERAGEEWPAPFESLDRTSEVDPEDARARE
jgi:1-acyl-sn-glycerol-3-phosphate acyltransferase